MNIPRLISFFLPPQIPACLHVKTALQNLYVSLVQLKPYKLGLTLCNCGCDNWAET